MKSFFKLLSAKESRKFRHK